jgi:hypothetical protein
MRRAKTAKKRNESIGINLENVNPVLSADNEHTAAGTVALARAVTSLAEAISAAARALEEAARASQKAGVLIGNCHIGPVDTGISVTERKDDKR